jgi:tryptophan synthase beta chain
VDTDQHAASLTGGVPGILHGNKTYLLQDEDGQITEAHSISAGLDYPGIGPEHAWLHENGRVKYLPVNDDEALQAFQDCCRLEGIIPALESAHAWLRCPSWRSSMARIRSFWSMSGRGDKDIFTVADSWAPRSDAQPAHIGHSGSAVPGCFAGRTHARPAADRRPCRGAGRCQHRA